jgi:hypothetical protein
MDAGYKGANQAFDAERILNQLGTKQAIYKEAMGPAQYDNYTKFWQQAQKDENTSGRVVSYLKNRMWLALPGAVAGLAAPGSTAAAAGALVLTDALMGKLMANPEIAALTTKALRTGITAPDATFTTRTIINALRGSEALLRTPEGKLEKVYVQENGSLSTMRPPQQ